MRSLFLKIFLSFLLVQAVSIALIFFRAQQAMPNGLPRFEAWREASQDLFKIYSQSWAEAAASQDSATLSSLGHLEQSTGMQFFIVDEHGTELLGKGLPLAAQELRGRAAGGRQIEWQQSEGHLVFARSVNTSRGNHYVVLAKVAEPWALGVRLPVWWVPRRLVFVFISGIVSLALAYYLTRPVRELRAATQKLATGDLSARAVEHYAKRDEISELIHDFNLMAQRIESLITAQRRLICDISHELRSPLARLSVALGLARQKSSPEVQASLDRIELEAKRLNDMIEQLLMLSRLESEVEAPQQDLILLPQLIKEIVADAQFEARNRGCHFQCDLSAEGAVNGNPDLLRSAIENVIRNSIQYTAPGSTIEIKLSMEQNDGQSRSLLAVRDHGPGVAETELKNLFRPFYRLDHARARGSGGIGLGLAITQRAIRACGGKVRALNAEGGGLLIEIRIPAAAVAEAVLGRQ